MLEIVFTLCMIGASDSCVSRVRTYDAPPTPFACASATQYGAAELKAELPNYAMKRSRCGRPGQSAKA